MSTQVQYRRGSNVEVAAFTGAVGELLVDTTNKLVVVSDGSTAGGFPQVGLTASQTLTNKIYQGTSLSVTGNVTSGNVLTGGLISATGNITGNFFNGNGSLLTGIDATSIQSGTSNVRVVSSGGNVTASVGGTSNVVVIATTGQFTTGIHSVTGNISGGNLSGTSIVGTLTTAAQTNITSVGTLGSLAVTGNITSGNLSATNHTGTIVSVTGNISGGNLSGTSIVGTLTTAAQTNITSVGTLGSLAVTGNITSGNLSATNHTGTIVSVTGNISGGNLSGTSIVGTLTTAAQTNITSVGTLGALAVTGNISAGNFIGTLNGSGANVSSISATNISSGTLAQARLANAAVTLGSTALTLGATVTTVAGLTSVTSTTFVGALTGAATSATTAGTVTTAAQPNITSVGILNGGSISSGFGAIDIGTDSITVGSIINANANGIGNIGSTGTRFNTIFGLASSAQYADLAEKYTADADYPPGTVVSFGGAQEVTISSQSHATQVAGVVSTQPAYTMNDGLVSEHTAMVALTGRVPCLVLGPIAKGDRLVASATSGHAQRLDPAQYEPGCIIGKALEHYDVAAAGTIEVAVGRF